MSVLWLALAAPLALLVAIVWIFNRLVTLRNQVAEAWSGIDVQLRRRHDLVPALAEVAEAYRVHEQTVLLRTADARARAEAAGPVSAARPETAEAESALGHAIAGLIAIAEDYPDLKADSAYLRLQASLREVEDHLQMARRYYNGTVRNLNIAIETVPMSLVARATGFRRARFFELDEKAARQAPQVA